MLTLITTIGLWTTAISSDGGPIGPGLLCYSPVQKECCEQTRDQFDVRCGDTICYGTAISTGNYVAHQPAPIGVSGYTAVAWQLTPNGKRCYYHHAWCDEYGFCHIDEPTTIWDCHDEKPSGKCFGGG